MNGSKISWTIDTWNPWVGCDKVASECAHCYIDREIRKQIDWQKRDGSKRKPWGELYLSKTWRDPYTWEKELQGTNDAKRVFTCSLSDFFHAKVDGRRFLDSPIDKPWFEQHRISGAKGGLYHQYWRDAAWQVIKDTPHIVYQILTKRPERIVSHLPNDWGQGYPNVWLGTSVGCGRTLSKIDSLREVPVHPDAVRFVSAEPLLEDISGEINLDGIGWLIVGGESGSNPEYRYDPAADWRKELDGEKPGRRTMDLGWAYKLYMMANNAGVPFFFKQVTSGRSGVGADRLTGKVIHEFPAPPNGGVWWTPPSELMVLR